MSTYKKLIFAFLISCTLASHAYADANIFNHTKCMLDGTVVTCEEYNKVMNEKIAAASNAGGLP